jgi:protein O-mannosyl-transferase
MIGMPRSWSNKNHTLSAVFILCLLGIAIYSNSFLSSFHLDDYHYIIENEKIKDIGNLPAIWDVWPARFIGFLSFALNYHFHQLNPAGYHLINFIIHLGTSILVWWFVKLTLSVPALVHSRLSPASNKIALFAALIFLSHPVQTEPVNYIYQRSTLLGAFFYLAAVCLYVRSRLLQIKGIMLSRRRYLYLFSWIFAVCAVCTKENTVTLALSLILYEYSFLRQGSRIRFRYILPFLFLIPVIPLLLYFKQAPNTGDIHRLLSYPFAARDYFLTQFRVLVTYIRLLFIPVNQNLDYNYPVIADPLALPVFASGVFLAAVIVFAARSFRRNTVVAFGILWFFLTLLPESSIIPLSDVIFEHRLYLPMAGFSLSLAAGAFYLSKSKKTMVAITSLSLLIAAYSILSYQRNKAWKSEITLWSDVIKKSPGKPRGYTYLCSSCIEAGRNEEAIYWCNQALRFRPVFPRTYYNLGNAYANIGRREEAIEAYENEIRADSKFIEAYNNLASVYADGGDVDKAIEIWSKLIQLDPAFATAHFNLAVFYFQNKQYDLAIAHCDKVISLGNKVDEKFLRMLKPYRRGHPNNAP